MNRTRGDMLADLADSINELTEPRQHSEYLEATITQTVVTRSGKTRLSRTQQRKAHIVTLPPLLTELHDAAVPGASEGGVNANGSFESRPAAELEPLAVLREIEDDAGFWARTFSIDRADLAGTLHALVSAPHDLEQLAHIERQAARWVRRARIATGFDKAPVTLNQPCPYCLRRHALTITGDLLSAKCTRCGTSWSPDTIGLLADMLHANENQELATTPACWMPDCTRLGVHDEHGDSRGRTWRDSCDVVRPAV